MVPRLIQWKHGWPQQLISFLSRHLSSICRLSSLSPSETLMYTLPMSFSYVQVEV
nr:hypothetical protein I308_01359 [Cryptococcus tetragattii IND107]